MGRLPLLVLQHHLVALLPRGKGAETDVLAVSGPDTLVLTNLLETAEHQALVLDAKVHRLRVRDDLSGLPRALAASSKSEEPLPRAHAAAVVREGANVLKLLVEEHHVLVVPLIIRQRRPDEVRLHRRDGVLAPPHAHHRPRMRLRPSRA